MPNLKKKHMQDKDKPVSVLDVAAYIISKQPEGNPLTAWKLQKLVYYAQAWSLVWNEQPLFKEPIFAWANGPVVKELYKQHKGQFSVPQIDNGHPDNLSERQKDSIDRVLDAYGDKTAQWLSDLTHTEQPWIEARSGLEPGERGEIEINLAAMHEYYSSIDKSRELK